MLFHDHTLYIYIYINFLASFYGRCSTAWRLHSHYENVYFLTLSFQKFLVLIKSSSEGWKDEITMKPSSGFELVYQPSYCQIWIKVAICQSDSIMTFNCELCQSEYSVFSGRIIIKLSRICFFCTYVDQMIIQQRLIFCSKFSFTIFLLMFFPLFSKVFTNTLKIYELPKINNTTPKYCQTLVSTIIMFQANSMSQLHLASEICPY